MSLEGAQSDGILFEPNDTERVTPDAFARLVHEEITSRGVRGLLSVGMFQRVCLMGPTYDWVGGDVAPGESGALEAVLRDGGTYTISQRSISAADMTRAHAAEVGAEIHARLQPSEPRSRTEGE